MTAQGFEPPPYPHDRLVAIRERAQRASSGDVLDLSVGNPGDPLPRVVADALTGALEHGVTYPPSVGSAEFRRAASEWMARRLGVSCSADSLIACVGTKEVVAGLPRWLSLRDPSRSAVLFPAVAYPTYEMGARLAGLEPIPVPVDAAWRPDLSAVAEADADRALLLWLNEPGNPTGSVVDEAWYSETVAWARERGIVVASDECYVEFVFEGSPATALSAGADGVLAVHSLSKRSNMAGMRAGFVAGDPDLVRYLGEVRKHAGLMTPGPVQVAAAAALGDDDHVSHQRDLYAERRRALLTAIDGTGVEHDGGPATFYLWLRAEGVDDGWTLAERFADAGIVVAPGDFYGSAAPDHARVALVVPMDRMEPALERLASVLAREGAAG